MPFQVDHKLNVDIPTQVTDGLREAILTGYYKPGDVLPRIREFTRGLHVSLRALLPAYRTLKKEGLISPRSRLGTVVVGPKADVFRGRVVIVNQGDTPAYFDAVVGEALTRRLNAAGYLVVSVSAIPLGRRRDDADVILLLDDAPGPSNPVRHDDPGQRCNKDGGDDDGGDYTNFYRLLGM